MYAPASLQMFWYKFVGFSKYNYWQNLCCQLLGPLVCGAANPISNTPVYQSPGVHVSFGGASRIAARFMIISRCHQMFARIICICSVY